MDPAAEIRKSSLFDLRPKRWRFQESGLQLPFSIVESSGPYACATPDGGRQIARRCNQQTWNQL